MPDRTRHKRRSSKGLPARAQRVDPSSNVPAGSLLAHYREKADWAASLATASSSEDGKQKVAEFVANDPWYATDHAFPIYSHLIGACRIAYGHVFMSKDSLGAEPTELLSQSGRWLTELYFAGLNLFRVEFLIQLGRRQTSPVKLGRRAATCYIGLSLNVGQTLAEILLNVWNSVPDQELSYEQMVQMDRQFAFTQLHLDRIRSLVDLEFGLGISVDVDRLFEEVRIGIQQERAVLAPVKAGAILLSGDNSEAQGNESGEADSWLGASGSHRQEWSKPDSIRGWAKVFGVSFAKMKALLKDGPIRSRQLGDKLYQIHVTDLPVIPPRAH